MVVLERFSTAVVERYPILREMKWMKACRWTKKKSAQMVMSQWCCAM